MTGRVALDPGGDLPALLQVETWRLKVDRGQHRAGAAAPPPLFLCHRQNPATESVAPQMLGQKKPLYPQETQ